MRKIEQWMVDSINTQREQVGKIWFDCLESTKDNTKVLTRYRPDGEYVTTVYLYDNMIAQYSSGSWGFNLAGWNTPTTKSRINALAKHWGRAGVHQKNKVLYSGDKQINLHDWF